jgi:hypothetical protein
LLGGFRKRAAQCFSPNRFLLFIRRPKPLDHLARHRQIVGIEIRLLLTYPRRRSTRRALARSLCGD